MSKPASLIYGSARTGTKVRDDQKAIGRECPDSYEEGVFETSVSSNREVVTVVLYSGPNEAEANAEYRQATEFLNRFRNAEHPFRRVRQALELVRDEGLSLEAAAERILNN